MRYLTYNGVILPLKPLWLRTHKEGRTAVLSLLGYYPSGYPLRGPWQAFSVRLNRG